MLESQMSRMLDARLCTLLYMATLADRVKEAAEAAKANGYSVKKIADECRISVQSVYQWLDGSTKSIDGGNLVELADLSGYNHRWIMKGVGPKSDSRPIQQAIKIMRQMTPARQADAVKIIAPLLEPDGDHGANKRAK
jgi:transcriptional regulator with XRE-family HTH domain